MAQLYADEVFSYPVVEELRQLGHDVLTVQEAGRRGDSDLLVLTHAIQLGRAVWTCNRRHFIRLHKQHPTHTGIFVCTADDAAVLAARIDTAIQATPSLVNQLL